MFTDVFVVGMGGAACAAKKQLYHDANRAYARFLGGLLQKRCQVYS